MSVNSNGGLASGIGIGLFLGKTMIKVSFDNNNINGKDESRGDKLITKDGKVISDSDLIPDTPHNKFVTKLGLKLIWIKTR